MAGLAFFPSLLLAGLIVHIPPPGTQENRKVAPQTKTDVDANPEQPAGAPILLTLKLTNTGGWPFRYAIDVGSVDYPSARLFRLRMTDSKGKVREVPMANDSGVDLVGSHIFESRSILPGQSISFPAVIGPLVPGKYTIEIRGGKRAEITVKEDAKLGQKWDQQILEKVYKGDSFALFVAGRYLTKGLMATLLDELSSNDSEVANRAADILAQVPRLPADSSQPITRALTKQLVLANQRGAYEIGILSHLVLLASRAGTDEALEAVLKLAEIENLRKEAVFALGNFKQEKAIRQLRAYLKDKDEEIRFHAAHQLADQDHREALPILLGIALDPNSQWRSSAIPLLVKFPDDPRVEQAMQKCLGDPDNSVNMMAELALRQLANQKKQKP